MYSVQTMQGRVAGPSAPRSFVSARPSARSNAVNNSVQRKGKKKKNGIPSVADYLGADADYKNTINDLTRNFQSLQTQNVTNRGNLQQDFNDTKTRLGDNKEQELRRLQADFAARGLFGSGLSLDRENQFNLDYQNQFGDAETSYQRNLSQLLTDLANAQSLFAQQKKDAKLSAIRRRAEKYGIRS